MERIQYHEEGPVIYRVIDSSNKSHPSTATSVNNLARAYQEFDELQKAAMMREQSLDMKQRFALPVLRILKSCNRSET